VIIASFVSQLRGRVRLARGRCPSCASESASAETCGICRDYRGPFPAEEQTLLRWYWRFEGLRRAAVAHPMLVRPAWSRIAQPLGR
jgi:hypothetical protein